MYVLLSVYTLYNIGLLITIPRNYNHCFEFLSLTRSIERLCFTPLVEHARPAGVATRPDWLINIKS